MFIMRSKVEMQELKKKRTLRRLVAAVGTLMIIATFIVRDVLRETKRDELTKLQDAQAVFLSRSDNSFVMIRVVDLTSDVVGLIHEYDDEREKNHLPPFQDPLMPTPSLIEIEDNLVLSDGMVLQNVESLLQSVPTAIEEEKEYSLLKERYLALKQREKKQIAANTSQVVYATPDQMAEVKSFNSEAGDLRQKVLDLANRIFTRTAAMRFALEDSYERMNYIFYIVFAVGVLAHLWGNWAGLELEQD
jgi:hypothetical protein